MIRLMQMMDMMGSTLSINASGSTLDVLPKSVPESLSSFASGFILMHTQECDWIKSLFVQKNLGNDTKSN